MASLDSLMTTFDSFKQTAQGTMGSLSNRAITVALVTIAIVTVLWTGFHFFIPHVYTIKTTSDVRNLIISGVNYQTELISASTNAKATVVIKQVGRILGIPVGETNLVYEGVGTVQAGIDLSELEVEDLDTEHRAVYILLPPPKISAVNLNISHSSTLADYRKWFGKKAGAAIFEEAQRQANARIREEACANHILQAANANSKRLIEDLLSKVGLENTVVETQAPDSDACEI